MNFPRKAVLTGLALAVMGLSAAASAHDRHDHRHWKHDHRHWKHGHHPRHWHGRHYDRYVVRPYNYPPPYVVRERVVVPRPVYVAPPVPYYYGPVHNPGIVVHVDVPPIVIPIR